MCVARDDEHGPTGLEPYLTEYGLATGGRTAGTPAVSGDLDGSDDDIYEIEHVVQAERIGNKYKVWLKWKGHASITWRWRHELVKETTNAELLSEIENAVQAARDRHRAEHGHLEDDDEPDPVVPPTLVGAPSTESAAEPMDERTARRARRAARMALVSSISLTEATTLVTAHLRNAAMTSLIAFKSVCYDYCLPSNYL